METIKDEWNRWNTASQSKCGTAETVSIPNPYGGPEKIIIGKGRTLWSRFSLPTHSPHTPASNTAHVHFPNFMIHVESVIVTPRIAKDAKKPPNPFPFSFSSAALWSPYPPSSPVLVPSSDLSLAKFLWNGGHGTTTREGEDTICLQILYSSIAEESN